MRPRLDEELVRQGFFRDTDEALRSVLAGEVSTTNRRLTSPGERVKPGIALHVRGHIPYVSRGGLKLQQGLDAFDVSPEGLVCLDVGCSTGGFTDCLLRRGAASVLSVDVGYAQFDWSLRNDPRVTLLERTNICDVATPERIGSIDLAVCDVSFTSIRTILPAVTALLNEHGTFLTLVKPQFEAERDEVEKGGIVRDEAVWRKVLLAVIEAFLEHGLTPLRVCASPITGHKGNHEFLLLGQNGAAVQDLNVEDAIQQAMQSK